MIIQTRRLEAGYLAEYAKIPIVFRVESRFRVELVDCGLSGFELTEEPVEVPYAKDYDVYRDDGPVRWFSRFDTKNWGLLAATDGGALLGGAVLAYDTPGLHMLAGRKELAVLWDLRVHPDYRRRGIGSKLFQRATQWAEGRGCTQLKIETQNVNVRACRFYIKQGCILGGVDLYGYRGAPEAGDEVMFLFYLDL